MSRVGLMLRAAANALLVGIFEPTREQKADAAAKAVRDHFGKRQPRQMSDITDPYFGIKSKGRTGAKARAEMMAEARRETRIGKAEASGLATSRVYLRREYLNTPAQKLGRALARTVIS